MTDAALGAPVNGIVEIAGPERFDFAPLVQRYLAATSDTHEVVTDPHARFFGLALKDTELVPGPGAKIYPARFGDWLARQ